MDPVNVFDKEGTDIGTRAGVMKRQARGGGPMAIGASSAQTVEEKADGVTQQPQSSQLRRRLGRGGLKAVPEARRALRGLLRQWGRARRADVARLVSAELLLEVLELALQGVKARQGHCVVLRGEVDGDRVGTALADGLQRRALAYGQRLRRRYGRLRGGRGGRPLQGLRLRTAAA